MAVSHERVERLERLGNRGQRIEAVDLVEVDVIHLQPLQAGLGLRHDMGTRSAAGVRAFAHRPQNLGRDHHLVARNAEVADGLTKDPLALAARIDIGGVDEIDAGVEGRLDQRVGLVLAQLADLAPHALRAAEGHGAEAEFGDQEAARAESAVTHGMFLCLMERRGGMPPGQG